MPSQPLNGGEAPSRSGGAPGERRGWVSTAVAAVAISALGMAAAGTMPLTTSAHTKSAGERAVQTGTLPSGTTGPAGRLPSGTTTSVTDQGPLRSFAPRGTPVGSGGAEATSANEAETSDALVRAAVVKERAAQRAETLAAAAEAASRMSRTASQQVRAKKLAAADRSARVTAVQIASERRRRAIAARVAAQYAREQAAAAAAAAAAQAAAAEAAARRSASADTSTDNPAGSASGSTTTSSTEQAPGGGRSPGSSESRAAFSPVPGAVIGSPFGATGIWARYHTGLDFRAAQGTPIRAVRSGVVLYAGNSGNWAGNHVAIRHASGVTTMSSHMSSMSVHAGERVRAGQVIGRVGATGRAFGAHLHFELYPRGVRYGDIYRAINPVPWLRANGVRTG